jgi:hypothetical protein
MLAAGARSKKGTRNEQRDTYVVEIFVREPVTFDFSYAIDEQSTCCTHETACGLHWEGLLQHAEEGMGIEWWVLVSRGPCRCLDGGVVNQGWRAGRRGGR